MFIRDLRPMRSITLSDLVSLGVPASSVAELVDEFDYEPVFPFSHHPDDCLIER